MACKAFCEARYEPADDIPYIDVIKGCERVLQTALASKAQKDLVKLAVDEWIDTVFVQEQPEAPARQTTTYGQASRDCCRGL